jgi:hypothetical protein
LSAPPPKSPSESLSDEDYEDNQSRETDEGDMSSELLGIRKRVHIPRGIVKIDELERTKETGEVCTPSEEDECADAVQTPVNFKISVKEGETQKNRTAILRCIQKEIKRVKIVEKKKKKERQSAKEKRKFKEKELEKKKHFNKESTSYDGEY